MGHLIIKDTLHNNFINAYQQEQLQIHPHAFFPSLISEIMQVDPELQIFELKVYVSYFSFKIFVYRHNQNAEKEQQEVLGRGAFGTVFSFDENIAIKNIPFCSEDEGSKKNAIRKTLEEYSLYKIAGALQVGPKLLKCFGVDIIIYNDCLQFSMEQCRTPSNQIFTNGYNSLLKSLYTLHHFKITHQDIKPENIMYSPSLKKLVFIDYNCGEVLKQQIGTLSYTGFKGTPIYCSEQMKQLLRSKSKGLVDLYYNDVHCLRKSIEQGSQCCSVNKENPNENGIFLEKYSVFYYHLRLRKLFFEMNIPDLQLFLKKYKNNLFPSSKLLKIISKTTYQDDAASKFDGYHLIYSSIREIMQETYRIFLISFKDTKFQVVRPNLLESFTPHLNSDLNEAKTAQKKQNLKVWTDFVTYQPDSQVLESSRGNLFERVLNLTTWRSGFQSLNNSKIVLRKIKTLAESSQKMGQQRKRLMKLYYQFLMYFPDDETLLKCFNYVKNKIEGEVQQPVKKELLFQQMVMFDFKNKESSKQEAIMFPDLGADASFMGLLVVHICIIKQISVIKLKLRSFQLKNAYFYIQRLQKQKNPPIIVKWMEQFLNKIKKVLQSTNSSIFQKRVQKLEKWIARCQSRSSRKQNSSLLLQIKKNRILVDFLKCQYTHGNDIGELRKIVRYHRYKKTVIVQYVDRARDLLEKVVENLMNKDDSYDFMHQKLESLYIMSQSSLQYLAEINVFLRFFKYCRQNMQNKRGLYLNIILKTTNQYSLMSRLSDVKMGIAKQTIVDFNIRLLQMVLEDAEDIDTCFKQEYLHRFMAWHQEQEDKQYHFQMGFYHQVICILYNFYKYKQIIHLSEIFQKKFDLFECLDSPQQAQNYAEILCLSSHTYLILHGQVSYLISQIIVLVPYLINNRTAGSSTLSLLNEILSHNEEEQSLFDLWNTMAIDLYHDHSKTEMPLIFFLRAVQNPLKLLYLASEGSINQSVSFSKRYFLSFYDQFICLNQKYQASLIVRILVFVKQILGLKKYLCQYDAKISCLVYEHSLLVMLKRIEECPRFIRSRIQEKIFGLVIALKKLQKYKKYQQGKASYKISLSIFINDSTFIEKRSKCFSKNLLTKLKLRKLRLKYLRNELIKKEDDEVKAIDFLKRMSKYEEVRRHLQVKIRNIYKNKLMKCKCKKHFDNCEHRANFQWYLNTPEEKVFL